MQILKLGNEDLEGISLFLIVTCLSVTEMLRLQMIFKVSLRL